MSASDKSKLDGIEPGSRASNLIRVCDNDPEMVQTDNIEADEVRIGALQVSWVSGCGFRNSTWRKTTIWFSAFKNMAYAAVATVDDYYQHNLWSYQVRVQKNAQNNCTVLVTNGSGNDGTPTQDCRWTFVAIGYWM